MSASEADVHDCQQIVGAAQDVYYQHDYAGVIAKVEEARRHPGWPGLSAEVQSAAFHLEAKAQGYKAYQEQSWEAAIQWFTELADRPQDLAEGDRGEVFHHLGVAWMHQGDLAKAVQSWEAGGWSDPNWPPEYEAHLRTL